MKFVPIVSIISPVYNIEKYLPQFIDSVLSQTFSDFELILIDDGSTDNSYDVCREYAKCDSRITIFHQENSGVSFARNKGLEISKGKWICFVDPDDYVVPEFLETILEDAALDSDIQLVECYTKKFDDNGTIFPYKKFYEENKQMTGEEWLHNTSFYFTRNVILPRSVLYLATILKDNNIFFNGKYAVCEDCDFVFRAAKYIKKVYIDVSELYCYRQRMESAIHVKGISKAQFSAIQFYHDYISENEIIDYGIKNGFLFGELKVYIRLIIQELILECFDSKYKENLLARINFVKANVNKLFSHSDIECFFVNPIVFLQKQSRMLTKQISWHLQIKFKYHLFAILISHCNLTLLKFLLKLYLRIRRLHV